MRHDIRMEVALLEHPFYAQLKDATTNSYELVNSTTDGHPPTITFRFVNVDTGYEQIGEAIPLTEEQYTQAAEEWDRFNTQAHNFIMEGN